jgi:primary-amine oxidase
MSDRKMSVLGSGLLAVVLLSRASLVRAHPLDGLSAAEIQAVADLLKAEAMTNLDSRFSLIELKEPEKSEVLAWQAGSPEPRAATAYVLDARGAFKAEVDLAARRVTRWEPSTGEPMMLLEELGSATQLALSDPSFVEGLQRRGVLPTQVFCAPLTAGWFGAPEDQGRRLMKVTCFLNPAGSNYYATPIEGLFAKVDLRSRTVLEVVDTGAVPLATDPWGYTKPELEQRFGALRELASPVTLSQPGGKNFRIEAGLVEWDMWRFRVRVDRRPGIVLSLIEANDGAAWRSVLYQAHLSEVFVPYMDPDENWYWRTYMDSGEYGFGIFLSPLRAGLDCPAYATFLPAVVNVDDGSAIEIPDAVCVFERDTGDPAWRHYEFLAQTSGAATSAEGRPSTELVVRTASEVGNYDYLVDYVFQQNGMIRIMLGATGLDAVKGVASASMADATAAADTKHGTLIAPHLVAPNHDHFFSFRLDFDIDGTENMFVRTRLAPAAVPQGLPRRSLWETVHEMPQTELEGRYRVDPATPAEYHVMNMTKTTALGHAPSYMILPQNSVAYSPLDVVADPPAKRNGYIEYTFWNTPYAPDERYAGGEYALQSDGTDGLPAWVQRNRPIHDADLVTWYTMGLHHVAHAEDWPVMSTMWKGITLMPFNFFEHNPAMMNRLTPQIVTEPASSSVSLDTPSDGGGCSLGKGRAGGCWTLALLAVAQLRRRRRQGSDSASGRRRSRDETRG